MNNQGSEGGHGRIGGIFVYIIPINGHFVLQTHPPPLRLFLLVLLADREIQGELGDVLLVD
jgi:hypothetical protein